MNSYHPKSLLNDLQYYITPPHDCSYLEKKSARMVFLDPAHRIDVVTLSEISRVGFRRSGDLSTVQSVICVDSAYLAAYQCANLK